MKERLTAIVGARIGEFRKKMAQVNKIARTTASKIVKNVGADTSEFKRKMQGVKKSLKTLPNKVVVDVKLRYQNYKKTIGQIASFMRAFDEIGRSTTQGGLIFISPAAIPILASAVGLIGSLGPMIGVLGGSTFALATAFGFAGVAAVAFGAAAVPTISKLFEETGKLTAAQEKARGAFDKFKSTWSGITQDLEKPVLQAFTKAFTAFNTILQIAKPLFESAAVAVNNLMSSFNKSLDSAPIKAFFDYMNKQAGPMLETLGKATGNFLKGFLSMMTAFGPLAEKTAQGFLNMSKGFATWAEGLSKSKKFQSFVNYINENLPKIRAIFRDALAGLIYFFAAFGPMSSDMMTNLQDLMGKFKEWASSLGSNQAFQTFLGYIEANAPKVITLIGNLWDLIINLGIALAPMGSKMLNLVNGFLEWTNAMMENHPIIGKIIALAVVLGGALLALIPNIVAISSFFSGFGTVLMGIASKVGPVLLPFLTSIGSAILRLGSLFLTNAYRIAASWLIAMGPIGWVIAAVVALVAVIIYNWDSVKSLTVKAWTAISTAVSVAVKLISSYIQKHFPVIYHTIMVYMQMVSKIISSILTYIKSTFSNVLAFLKALVNGDFQGMKNAISKQMQASRTLISQVLSAIKTFFSTTLSAIVSNVKSKFAEFLNAVREKMTASKQKIVEIWNQAKAFLDGIDLYSIGVNIIQGLINGIGSMASAVASKVKGIASGIKDTIQGALDIHSPSRFTDWIGRMFGTGMVNGIGSMIKPVSAMADKMARASMIEPQRTELVYNTSVARNIKQASVETKKSSNGDSHNTSGGKVVIENVLMIEGYEIARITKPFIDTMLSQDIKWISQLGGIK